MCASREPGAGASNSPQHRFVTQGAWEVAAQWRAGTGADLTAAGAASTAVVAALSFWDYSLLLPAGGASDAYKATGRCFSVAAGRVSFVHGFKGDESAIES